MSELNKETVGVGGDLGDDHPVLGGLEHPQHVRHRQLGGFLAQVDEGALAWVKVGG